MRPGLSIVEKNTNLSQARTKDGTTLLVLNVPTAYASTITASLFYSLPDAVAAGYTEAKDLSNNVLAWEHIKDFYAVAPVGTELHVLVVAEATTYTNLFTDASASNVLLRNKLAGYTGDIKIVLASLKPATETGTTSISADLATAIPLAQVFANAERDRLRPISVVLEGRNFQGTAAAAADLRALLSGKVSVVCARDAHRNSDLVAAGNTGAGKHAAIGLIGGSIALAHVGRSIGRVLSGQLPMINKLVNGKITAQAEFSGGAKPYVDINEAGLDVLSDKGYIYMDTVVGQNGWYWVDDHTCTLGTRSDAYISLNRVFAKISRICVATYSERIKDELAVQSDSGKLTAADIATYEGLMQKAVEVEMIANPDPSRVREISDVKITIDPNQLVRNTGKLVVQNRAVPLVHVKLIEGEISLVSTL